MSVHPTLAKMGEPVSILTTGSCAAVQTIGRVQLVRKTLTNVQDLQEQIWDARMGQPVETFPALTREFKYFLY
jgi:hypothetical protein